MSGRLDGRYAIVTGGTRGIGRKIVELFSAEGAEVAFTGRDTGLGEAVSRVTGATFVEADAALLDHADEVLRRAAPGERPIDILVNNAGNPGAPQGVEAATPEGIADAIALHLRAPWLLIAKVAPRMRSSGGGSIINICSVAGQRVGAASIPYSVSKAALIHLTRCAAAEFGPDGIRVNSVSPGFIATEIHTAGLDVDSARSEKIAEGARRWFLSRQALPQTGQPKDVADAALFLASDESKFLTGADIVVDGGLVWGRPSRI